MNDEVVTRLYRCLVEELRRRGHSEEEPVLVSDLYQDLVPYRAVRSALGVELNADYEHALLRLLAGERDLLRLDPPEARDELRREVETAYPFVGLFRKFSASSVRVSMSEEPAPIGEAPDPAADREAKTSPAGRQGRSEQPELELEPARQPGGAGAPRAPVSGPRIAAKGGRRPAAPPPVPARRGGSAPLPAAAPVHIHRDAPAPDPTERLTHAGADCVFCGEDLPTGRRIRFCPYCGGDQRLRPCPRCEAVLEREWRYCISCGHEVVEESS